jgi:hypothetical protein
MVNTLIPETLSPELIKHSLSLGESIEKSGRGVLMTCSLDAFSLDT